LLFNDNDFIDLEVRNSLQNVCNIIALKIENLRVKEIISKGLDKDPETGIYNENKFKEEIEKEIKRVNNHTINSCLAAISIDEYESIDLADPVVNNSLLHLINGICKKFLTKLDSVGILNNQIYIILSGKDSSSSKLWAEQLRNKIASSQIEINGKMINVTISIGICCLDPENTIGELINNSNTALNSSKVNSNSVSVY